MLQLSPHIRRHWPRYLLGAAILTIGGVLIVASGLHQELTFDAISLRYAELAQTIHQRPAFSALIGLAFYIAFVVFAVPGVWLLGIAYGLLFGWELGLPIILVGATTGASILYWAARSTFGEHFRSRLGNVLSKLAKGFRENAANYLLFLRFAPLFPFVLVNLAPGLLGVPFRTFLWTTLIGITPATIVYVYAGEGLRSVAEIRANACLEGAPPCGEQLSLFEILTPPVLLAFVGLALLALAPVVLRRIQSKA